MNFSKPDNPDAPYSAPVPDSDLTVLILRVSECEMVLEQEWKNVRALAQFTWMRNGPPEPDLSSKARIAYLALRDAKVALAEFVIKQYEDGNIL